MYSAQIQSPLTGDKASLKMGFQLALTPHPQHAGQKIPSTLNVHKKVAISSHFITSSLWSKGFEIVKSVSMYCTMRSDSSKLKPPFQSFRRLRA
jgi:hypothetical protein